MKLSEIIQKTDNLAEVLDGEKLKVIGEGVIEGYENDLLSRREWEAKNADALKLALQYSETKTFPWPNASNVKYPLVLVSCVQFNARAYPSLVPGPKVLALNTSPAAEPEEVELAGKVGETMNWEIMSGDWEDGHDSLLMMLPLIGTVFKKTYFDPDRGGNISIPIHPSNFVVDYWAKSLDTCERKTHVQWYRENEVREKVNLGLFLDSEYSASIPSESDTEDAGDEAKGFDRSAADDSFQFLEQCTWLDLDDDGYKEPYVVTVDKTSGKVARIVENFENITLVNNRARFTIPAGNYSPDFDDFRVGKITERQYYTKYGFIKSPDGSFYDVGLGTLLSPMNHAADSLINQLIDGGTLATASGGLLSRNIRVRSGNFNVMPGVFKRTDASSDELRNGVFPWPVKEPSLVLFQLLGLLLDAGQKIGSVSNAMMGENPGQNQPATTTMAVLEQGLQVFSAIYKRIYRSMTEEFRRWYELDREYAQNSNDYQFDPKIVRPTADPSAVAQSQRMLKAEALMGRVTQAPHLYGMEGAVKAELRYLEALDIQNADDWLKDAQPPQDPKAAVEKQKLEFEAKKFEMNFQLEVAKEERERNRTRSTILKDRATVETKLRNAALNEEKQAWQELLDVMNHELQVLDEQRKDRVEQPRDNEAA